MKLAHLGDLHIGRKFGEYDLEEDQRYIFDQMIDLLKEEHVDVVMISGDIYDKNRPTEASFALWDEFLGELNGLDVDVLITSGNHDSFDRLGIGRSILSKNNVHIETKYAGRLEKVVLEDEYGPVNVFMLPFIKPVYVRNLHDDYEGNTTHSAIEYIIDRTKINRDERNILMAHQFVVGNGKEPLLSESEVTPSVGGSDAVDTSLFRDFDYVALGHIHRPQQMGRETIRYCGSPLKYSFSEARDLKSVPIIDYKDELSIEFKELKPLRDVRVIEGPFEALLSEGEKSPSDDLIHAIITDDQEVFNPIARLRRVYPNTITLEISNVRTKENSGLKRAKNILAQDRLDLIAEFFKKQNNRDLKEDEKEYLETIIERVEER